VKYSLLPMTSYFCVCKLWVIPLKNKHLMKCLKPSIDHCVDWNQKYVNLSCNSLLWTVWMIYLFAWVRDSWLCQRWQTYVHCVTAWMTTCPLSVKQLDTACHVKFHSVNVQLSVCCPETSCTNLLLHNPCWLTNILLNVCLQWHNP